MPTPHTPRTYATRYALVDEGSVRMAPLLGVPGLLEEMGVDPDGVIAEAGLDAALFADPENSIAFADGGRFLALCAERTGCPHFGLLVGRNAGADVLGKVGHLAGSSPDLGSALRNAILYLHLHDRGAVPVLSVADDRAMLAYVVYQPDVTGILLIYDLSLAVTYNVLKALTGPDWKANEVCLCRPQPAEIAPYRRVFDADLRFGAEHYAVVFPASWLDHPLAGANGRVHGQIMQELEVLEAEGAGDLATQLRRVLRRMLIGGAGQAETCLGHVAEVFAIHRRTINRRLRAQGTTFKALVDEARYDVARQLLRDTRLPVVEIAATLDYSDASCFDRAFHRWSGMSPSAWRAAHAPC